LSLTNIILAHQKNTLFNDPIYGFISIETPLLSELINHPFFQRLRRISQMGLSSLVYPGAHHTRFEHALGAMHIMQKAIAVLEGKGVEISKAEQEAMQIAVLLHDIGHGPFSHATENILLQGVPHEKISLQVIALLNTNLDGQLDLAYQIFTNQYPRKFMHQLVSGQVDLDRLDYLKRDSFYTGVTEGNINTDRILAMMNVHNEELVFEVKGIHSLEKFLLARRLMYWQVYLHKTSLAAELLLIKTLGRFKDLISSGSEPLASSHFLYPFFKLNTTNTLDESILRHYLSLDDTDIYQLLKSWQQHPDLVLSRLSKQLIQRQLPKIKMSDIPFTQEQIDKKRIRLGSVENQPDVYNYFVFEGSISNQTYRSDDSQLLLLDKNNHVFPISKAINYLDFKQFSAPLTKYYLCYPKSINSL
jgi:HD superfamily phosphohydrolase